MRQYEPGFLYWEELEVSREQIRAFAGLVGDINPIHQHAGRPRAAGYQDITASGTHIAALLAATLTKEPLKNALHAQRCLKRLVSTDRVVPFPRGDRVVPFPRGKAQQKGASRLARIRCCPFDRQPACLQKSV